MGFFSKPEIRQFNYTPRYWDPRKEEMEQRRERIRKQLREEMEAQKLAEKLEKGEWSDDEFIPRTSQNEADITSGTVHRTTLQHGFLREQRGRAGVDDGNKWTYVVAISAVVLVIYLALNHFGI